MGLLKIVGEGFQIVILIGDVQNPDLNFDVPTRETIAGEIVELPEGVARFVGVEACVASLIPPVSLELAVETAGQVVVGK